MEGQPTKWERFRRQTLVAYCWCILLLPFYVLSVGPLYWEWYDGAHCGGSQTLVLFYLPLSYACELCEPVNDWVDWYIGVWNA